MLVVSSRRYAWFLLPRKEAADDATALDFVWETHVPKHWKALHEKAKVLNR
jgi:hypothetical protein